MERNRMEGNKMKRDRIGRVKVLHYNSSGWDKKWTGWVRKGN